MMRAFALCALFLSFAACQTYDFERVVPLAVAQTTTKEVVASKRLKPNVMMLVDTSGSMYQPTNPSAPNCTPGCGTTTANQCGPQCPTRISELKSAMSTFLAESSTVARFALTSYPADDECLPANIVRVALPPPTVNDEGTDSVLASTAQQIAAEINGVRPNGGTPTGASLEFVGSTNGLNDSSDYRDDFVLLLTDGLPNCNDSNANGICSCGAQCTQAQTAACNCTLGNCATRFCAKGCLDQDGTVQKVKALRQKGIRTIVVGFGAELASGTGPTALNAMAREGGFARECPNGTNDECGSGNTCDRATKQCTSAFYQAGNGTELAAALKKISESINAGDVCVYTLSARPSDPRYLAVIVDNQSVAPSDSTYSFDPNSNKVTFTGDICQRLKTSTTQNPVNVEFRIVERF